MWNFPGPVDVGKVVTEIDDIPLDDLVSSWREIQDEYDFWGPDGVHDQEVLDCAARLAADPGGGTAYVWVLGLTIAAPYTHCSGVDSRARAEAALRAADAALRDRPCDHDAHPYESHERHEDEDLPDLLAQLADDSAEWDADLPREVWRCPRNVAGFARIALDILCPGEVTDVPPRLSLQDREDIESLEALLELYPRPGTDVDEEIAAQGGYLYHAGPEERAGRLHVVRAVSWHAVSGMIRDESVLDRLIDGVERVLPDLAAATCDHAEHPTLSGHSTNAAELGIVLSSRAGRAVYERDRDHFGGGAPLERMVCPAFMAQVARETLAELRAGHDRLFGPRDTSHLDAEYLRADGRLDIEKITTRLERVSGNEKYADDLGLWAARRHDAVASAGDRARERVVLLLTAHRALAISYPAPPRAVTDGVLATMRTVAAAPRPDRCAHADAHPPLTGAGFRARLPHFYAPDEFPPGDDGPHSVEAWTCPGFAGEIAEKCVGAYGGDGV